MKILIAILLFSSFAFALTPAERKIVEQLRDANIDLKTQLEEADKRNESSQSALAQSSILIVEQKNEISAKEGEIKVLQDQRDQYFVSLEKEKKSHKSTLDKYHFVKKALAFITAAFAAVIGFIITAYLPTNPYNFFLPIGLGIGGFSIIYFFL